MKWITLGALALLSTATSASDPAPYYQRDDIGMFERAQLGNAVYVTAFGIRQDSRCADRDLCFRGDRLIVAAVVSHRGREKEVLLELGRPVRFGNGSLMLVSTSTPASDAGAIALKCYRLDLRWTPD